MIIQVLHCPYCQGSPPYTFFLLNGDMELYRNKHLFVGSVLKVEMDGD